MKKILNIDKIELGKLYNFVDSSENFDFFIINSIFRIEPNKDHNEGLFLIKTSVLIYDFSKSNPIIRGEVNFIASFDFDIFINEDDYNSKSKFKLKSIMVHECSLSEFTDFSLNVMNKEIASLDEQLYNFTEYINAKKSNSLKRNSERIQFVRGAVKF